MKWIFLAAGIVSVYLVYGHTHQYVLFAAFAAAFINFATFCIQYEDPAKRARNRAEERLKQLKPGGLHADEQARLRSAKPNITAEDRATRWNAMTLLNLVSGLAALGFCAYGIMARMGMIAG